MKTNTLFTCLLILNAFTNNSFAQTWSIVKGGPNSSNKLNKVENKDQADIGGRYNAGVCSIGEDIYLYGGWGLDKYGNTTVLDDLWKFNKDEKKWACLTSQKNTATHILPEPRSNALVFNHTNFLYVFFGLGYSHTGIQEVKDDCWKYNATTQQFDKLKPNLQNSIMPEPRYGSISWTTQHHFFILGGVALDKFKNKKILHDFWRYDIAQNSWHKISESHDDNNNRYLNGKLIDLNQGVTFSQPSYHKEATTWVHNGELYYYTSCESAEYLNNFQLWKYSNISDKWMLLDIAKSNTNDDGKLMNPGYRKSSLAWVEKNNVYLYGGFTYDSKLSYSLLDDTWKFDLTNFTWEKISGNKFNEGYANINYKEQEEIYKTPGARQGAMAITSGQNHFLIGGLLAENGKLKYRNDIWQLSIPTEPSHSNKVLPLTYGSSINTTNQTKCVLTISPNPANNYVNIRTTKSVKNIDIKIYTDKGKLVSNTKIESLSEDEMTTIDISKFESGYYNIAFYVDQIQICTDRILVKQSSN